VILTFLLLSQRMNIWFFSFFTTSSKCYHRGSNWGSSTRGTALTRYVFIGCYDSGNNPDSNACRFKVCLNPSKTEPGLVMWWSIYNFFVSTLKRRFWNLCSFFLSFCSIFVIISLYTLFQTKWSERNTLCFFILHTIQTKRKDSSFYTHINGSL